MPIWFAWFQVWGSPIHSPGEGHMESIPTADPSSDRTLKDAEVEAQRDYARLSHIHEPSWSIDIFTGIVRWTCSCPSPGPRNAAAMDSHILEMVRKARGPVRPPKR